MLYDAIEIGDYAFWRCKDLKEFIPYGAGHKLNISSIGDSAFGETAVEELNFLDSTFTTINATFRGCEALQSLYLPATLTEVGERSFEDCKNLTSLYIAATTPPTLSSDAFNVVNEELSIYVPAKSVEAYKSAEGWSEYADTFVAYDFEKNVVIDANGYEWVDLGLSVKWATCNVGATEPEEYGDYFAWGETSPKAEYTWDNSLTYDVPMSDISGDPQYDAATANWGGSWRMPTTTEMDELCYNCTWTWTSLNGVYGMEVTGPNGNSIFLPAAGYRNGSSSYYVSLYGFYWCSTPRDDGDDIAFSRGFHSEGSAWSWSCRDEGLSVRPVID